MKILHTKALIAIPVLLMIYTFFDSNAHFADKGCDGGTCSIYLLTYSIPLILAWLPSIGGTILILSNKQFAKIFGIILLVLSLLIFTVLSMFNYDIKELNTPFRIGIVLNFLLIMAGIFFAADSPEKTTDADLE